MTDQAQPATQAQPTTTGAKDHPVPNKRFELKQSRVAPGLYKPIPEETIYAWRAASRPFKPRNRRFFTTMIVIALLISLILFFAGQFLPIAVVISVVFLSYVLAVIPPGDASYKVTNHGIKIEESQYYWEEMGRFWFDEKNNAKILLIEIARFPGRLTMVINDENKKPLTLILSEVLLQQKPTLTPYEKAADWLQEKIPLD